MKKIILSLIVVLTFIAYSIHERIEESEVEVVAPRSLRQIPTFSDQTTVPSVSPSTQPRGGMMDRMMSGMYKDGSYTGSTQDVFYGNIQVRAIISGGKISDIEFLQYPNDRNTSIMINTQAMPFLKQEAIQVQSAGVDIVSGATDSSIGFKKSLADALAQAK